MEKKSEIDLLRRTVNELQRLSTERSNPASTSLDSLDTASLLRLIHDEDRKVPEAVGKVIEDLEEVVRAATASIFAGGRLVYVGAGTSGRLGVLDAAECPPTFGVPADWVVGIIAGGDVALRYAQEGAEDDTKQALRDLEACNIQSWDTVLGISARGNTPYVREFLREAAKRGAWTGLLTCNRLSTPPEVKKLVVLEVGPEILTGSTRMKAGAVTKLALTMISTATMIRLGRVQGNRMVDLQPNSVKLRARMVKMIMEEFHLSFEQAVERLEKVGGNLREAMNIKQEPRG